MKTLLTAILMATTFVLPAHAQAQSDSVTLGFGPETRMWVTGTSTIHDWECKVASVDGSLTAQIGGQLSAISATTVAVKVDDMDCDSGKMNKKLRSALNDDNRTPVISFIMDSADMINSTTEMLSATITGQLTLAGVTRAVEFPVAGTRTGNTMTFTGSVPVRMTEYGVDPPKAMLGTLKTGDDVVVHFEVVTPLPDAQ
ncbi:MAG: hypothetical protein COV99_08590 [Bacteroidetes bacterium CG12_big_fil_rev_8_21_14_0_65_60_17]|nr:MAG: hypothetical protein COV99_08590 [Bacteroidetes bacterium CG12_big_fil_rev_8_21_14_0_65_60_17]